MKSKPPVKQKMTKAEAGRMGAMVLNSDPVKKSIATKKAALTRKAANPNAFKEMGKLSGVAQKHKIESRYCK